MSLTQITDITNYQFSKNPIVGQFETDAYETTAGVAASIKIDASTADGANAVGGTILFQWATDSVLFTVATTPDNTGYQVRPKASLTDSQYADALVIDFAKNYIFSENYTCNRIGSSITIVAKNKGVEYALYDNFDSSNFGFVINATHNDGTDPVYAENYKMRADLWMESAMYLGDYAKRGTIELDPLDNKCVFYFQDEINSNLQYDLPAYTQTDISNCDNVIKRFYLRYLEKFGNPILNKQVNTTSLGYAIKAGIKKHLFVGTTNLIASKFRTTPGTFMTRQPRTKKVREAQKEFLYLCTNDIEDSESSALKIKVTITKKNDATVVVESSSSIYALPYRVECFPVGFTQLGLSSTVAWDDVKKYTIEIIHKPDDIIISEAFTFVPERDYFIDEHYLFFTQSLGGFDTVCLTGVLDEAIETEKDLVQTTRLFDTPVVTGESSEIGHQKSDKYKVNTGWISKAQVDWLEDVFLAEHKVVDKDGMFIPIIITTSALKKHDSNSTLFFYEFEYQLAYKNNVV